MTRIHRLAPLVALSIALLVPLDATAETAAQPCPAFEVSFANESVVETDTSGFAAIRYELYPWDELAADMAEAMQVTVSDPSTGEVFPGSLEFVHSGTLFWRPDTPLAVGSYDLELFVPAGSLDVHGCGWGSVDQEWHGTLLVTDVSPTPGALDINERAADGYEDFQYECCENGYGCWVSEAPFKVTLQMEVAWGADAQPWQGVRLEGTSDGVPAEEAPFVHWAAPDQIGMTTFTFPAFASRYCVRVFELDARDGSEVEADPICILDEAVEYLPAVGTELPLDCSAWRADDDDDVDGGDTWHPDGEADADTGTDTGSGGADTGSGGADTGSGGVDAARADWGPGGGTSGTPQDGGAANGADCGCSSVRDSGSDAPFGVIAVIGGLLGVVLTRRNRARRS